MRGVDGGWWRPFLATTVGVILAILIDRLTDYFTSTWSPVKEIKKSADTGPATLILVISVARILCLVDLVIAGTIFASILIFGGISRILLCHSPISYTVSPDGYCMLTLTGNNFFGPIADTPTDWRWPA
jgi:K(+)-stimulated pyrophosphate-energized sodium pump